MLQFSLSFILSYKCTRNRKYQIFSPTLQLFNKSPFRFLHIKKKVLWSLEMIKQHKIVFGNQSTYCSGSPGFVFVQSQYNREPHGAQRRRRPRPQRAAAVSMGSGGVCGGGSLSSFSSDALQNAANNVEPRTRWGSSARSQQTLPFSCCREK